MPLRRGSTLALGYNLHHLGHELTFSIPRFHTQWLSTLLQREVFRRVTLIAMPFAPQRTSQRFEDRPTVQHILRDKPASVAVDLEDYPSLAIKPGKRPTVFHEGGFQDMVRPFYLRSFFKDDNFPVTIGHHGLMPSGTLATFGLNLLLSDYRPHDSIICTSRASREIVQNTIGDTFERIADKRQGPPPFRGRLEVISPGVDTQAYRPRPKQSLRERFGLPKDAVVVLWFGRFDLIGKTNLLPLLRTFRYVVDDCPDVPLLLVVAGGRGTARDETIFKRYAEELDLAHHVRRLTSIPPEDDPYLYATADIFVCPSDGIFENFGLAPLQAMACGVPQVVSDWDGHRDTVVHGETGFLVPTHWGSNGSLLSRFAGVVHGLDVLPALTETTAVDIRGLRTYLGTLARNESLRQTMGERSRERATSLFSLDQVVTKYLALWGELVAQARANRESTLRSKRKVPRLLDIYRPQVTNLLGPETMFSVSEAGTRVLEGTEAAPIAAFEPSVIDPVMAWQVLGVVATRPYDAASIVRIIQRMFSTTSEAVWCNIMWLLKYGYLELAPDSETP